MFFHFCFVLGFFFLFFFLFCFFFFFFCFFFFCFVFFFFFSEFVSKMGTLHYLELVCSNYYFNIEKLLVLKQFKNDRKSEFQIVITSLVAEKYNHVKFTEKYMMC